MSQSEKVLLEENEIKPNKFVASAMLVVLGLITITEILNEINVFKVEKWAMRMGFILAAVFTLICQYVAHKKDLISNPKAKYFIIGVEIWVIFIIALILEQWASLIIFIPMVLNAVYRDSRASIISGVGCIITAFFSAPLALALGLWQSNYFAFLLEVMGADVSSIAITGAVTFEGVCRVILFVSFPRTLIVTCCALIMINGSRFGRNSVDGRIEAIHLAETDILTGLFNRISFESKLVEYRNMGSADLAVLYADADGLHELNNTQGHAAGDNLLKMCAAMLTTHFKDELVYRIGGDEFLVFIEHSSPEEIEEKIGLINDSLAELDFHMSMGYKYEKDCDDVVRLSQEAEVNMYKVKNAYYKSSGKDRRNR